MSEFSPHNLLEKIKQPALTAMVSFLPFIPGTASHAEVAAEQRNSVANAQSEATVMLRGVQEDVPAGSYGKGLDEDRNITSYCAATHIGEGWLVTEQHCFPGLLRMAEIWVDTEPFDLTTQRDLSDFSLWRDRDPDRREDMGDITALVTANDRETTFALLHVPRAARMSQVDVSNNKPTVGEQFVTSGYPEVNGLQRQAVAHFVGEISAGVVYEAFGYVYLDSSIYVFGYDDQQPIDLGFSGGGVVSAETGELAGTSLAIIQDEGLFRERLVDAGQDSGAEYDGLLLVSPINSQLIEEHKANVDRPSEDN